MSTKQLLLLAVGGAFGAISRFWLVSFVVERWQHSFPLGTLMVNTLGSFLIGIVFVLLVELLAKMRLELATDLRILCIVGFLGSLTTFSSFSLETYSLFERGEYGIAMAYVVVSVVLCLAFTMLGMLLGRTLVTTFF